MPPTLPSGAPSALPGAMQALEGESATTGSFTAPITDLFIEVFDLKEKDWLRRQAIVILLQQVLGGTIERKFRDTFRKATSEKGIDKLLRIFQDNMWPDGVRKPPTEPRTDQQRYDTRLSASRRLGALMPDVAANMIGRSNARHAASRMFGVLQDARLNQQLMLSVFDEVSWYLLSCN
jgi:sorting nexin-25